ncbi:MAG: DUF4097 family beta strand repeat-containing protein [Myxococcota bacterium]|nr:DUF4097 family beta strand repeat-containing protein [Myxococcota bacterium]
MEVKRNIGLAVIGLAIIACHTRPGLTADKYKAADQAVPCTRNAGDASKSTCEERTFTIKEKWDVIGVNAHLNGSIHVEGWDKDHIQVVARIRVWDSDPASAKELLNQIEILAKDQVIQAHGPRISGNGRGFSVDFDIQVPKAANLRLKALNGQIGIDTVSGNIDARAVNGGVKLVGLSGDVSVKSVNGSVSVALKGDRWRGSGLAVSTTNGSLKIQMPKNYSAELETKTVNGAVDFGFPVMIQGSVGKHARTTLGSGGAKIKFSTVNGSVKLIES